MPVHGCRYPLECNEKALCKMCAKDHHSKLEQEFEAASLVGTAPVSNNERVDDLPIPSRSPFKFRPLRNRAGALNRSGKSTFICQQSASGLSVWLALNSIRTFVAPASFIQFLKQSLGRKFIGIELDPDYFQIACDRIRKAYDQPDMFIAPPEPKQTQEAMVL